MTPETLETILAKTNLPETYQHKLRIFVENLKEEKSIACVELFGSAAYGKFDDKSDIDLKVLVESSNFITPAQAYDIVAQNYFWPLKVQIRSIREISPTNQITMKRGFSKYVANVSITLLGKERNLHKKFAKAVESDVFGKHAPNMWHTVYCTRKNFLMSQYAKYGNTHALRRIQEISPAGFFQDAVREVLEPSINGRERTDILKTFYDITSIESRVAELEALRQERDNFRVEDYLQLKEITEEAAWALNAYLNNAP